MAYEKEDKNTLKNELSKLTKEGLNIGIVIGPEGGIEKDEIDKLKQSGAKTITLGSRILRTETAAMYITSIITYELS